MQKHFFPHFFVSTQRTIQSLTSFTDIYIMQSYNYDNEDDGYEIFAAISHEMSSEDYDLLPQALCGPPILQRKWWIIIDSTIQTIKEFCQPSELQGQHQMQTVQKPLSSDCRYEYLLSLGSFLCEGISLYYVSRHILAIKIIVNPVENGSGVCAPYRAGWRTSTGTEKEFDFATGGGGRYCLACNFCGLTESTSNMVGN
jgi:hypothetical protein